MIRKKYSCATCKNLELWESPAMHWWCNKNKDCPCNGDEVPDYDFICDKFVYDEDKDYMND